MAMIVRVVSHICHLHGDKGSRAGWAIGHSYADHPVLQPYVYDPNAPSGSKFSSNGASPATIPRLYHSTALLLPDGERLYLYFGNYNSYCFKGSILVSGSNPNPDYTVGPDVTYPTDYRVERFFPSYYNQRRPQPSGLPTQLTYGGGYFNVSLSSTDLGGDMTSLKNSTVVVIRQGFSTHAMVRTPVLAPRCHFAEVLTCH